MDTKIASVKYTDEGVRILAKKTKPSGERTELKHFSPDEPAPDFVDIFRKLRTAVRKLLDLPAPWGGDTLVVRKVTFTETQGGSKAAIITAMAEVDCSTSPFNFSTPICAYEAGEDSEEGSNAPILPKEIRRLLDKLEVAAEAYLDGERAQGDFFRGSASPDPDEEEDDTEGKDDDEGEGDEETEAELPPPPAARGKKRTPEKVS